MIIKNFDLKGLNSTQSNFYLLYGENDGHKEKLEKILFLNKFEGAVERYEEKEILNDKDIIISGLLNKSFFDKEKVIIISRVTDKILNFIKGIMNKNIEDTKIILKSGLLDKKSKLRTFFEKEKSIVCVPFYPDDLKTLSGIANKFFKDNKISISQETINLIIDKCNGDRKNLEKEFQKILIYLDGGKKINSEQVSQLINLAENFSVSELIDSCLSNNSTKTIKILNENNYNSDDCMLILRTFLNKAKKVLRLRRNYEITKNIDETITNFRPPIFWKDKEIVKKQVIIWPIKKIEELIISINKVELQIKKSSVNSINIVYDFMLNAKRSSNS